jgi:hypothetical protein
LQHRRTHAPHVACEAIESQKAEMEDALMKHADPSGAIADMAKLPLNVSVGMLVAAQRGTQLTSSQWDQIATHMGTDLNGAMAKVQAINDATTAQFRGMARLVGVDADAAAAWLQRTKPDTVMSVLQKATIHGDPKAWKQLLVEAKKAGVK